MRRRRRFVSKDSKDQKSKRANVQDISDDTSLPQHVEEEEREVQVWNPDCSLSEEEIKQYLGEAEKRGISSVKAHDILSYCQFNVSEALVICDNFVEPDLLSDCEKQVVRCTMDAEKFRLLKVSTHQRCRPLKKLLPQQSTSSIMNYYYKNKFKNFEFVPRERNLRSECLVEKEEIESSLSLIAKMANKIKLVRSMDDALSAVPR